MSLWLAPASPDNLHAMHGFVYREQFDLSIPDRSLEWAGESGGHTVLFPSSAPPKVHKVDRACNPSKLAVVAVVSLPTKDVFISGWGEWESPSSPDAAGSMPSSQIAPYRTCW